MSETFTLSTDQATALEEIIDWYDSDRSQWFSLHGLAGTGKTSIVPTLRDELSDRCGIKLAAPTGKAVAVLNSKFGENTAITIHRLAYCAIGEYEDHDDLDEDGDPKIKPIFEEAEFGSNQLIICDESSMIGSKIFDRLMRSGNKFLFLGDPGQLPPVNDAKNPAMRKATLELEKIHRQAEGNPIIQYSHRIRRGQDPRTRLDGINHVRLPNVSAMADYVVDNEIQMLIAATNKIRHIANNRIRERLGFGDKPKFSEGEKVLILMNHYPSDVFNGEVYTIDNVRLRYDDHIIADLSNDFGGTRKRVPLALDNKCRAARNREIPQTDYGYCLTCHKAQGSQAESVAFIDANTSWLGSDECSWFYTAATRASEDLTVLYP